MHAVDGVDFEIHKGQTLGLVGESGCGKSLTSRALISINPKECETTGDITFMSPSEAGKPVELLSLNPNGRQIRSIRGRRIAMIFQEPMTAFSPMYTIGNQLMEAILMHRTKNKKEAKKIALEMLSKVGISDQEKRFDQYPHEFSGGMRQRAMISMALSCNPELLIADEPTTALDVTIQAQVLELMKALQQEFGMAILLVTHDLGIIAEMCDEVAVMYLGKIVEQAPVKELLQSQASLHQGPAEVDAPPRRRQEQAAGFHRRLRAHSDRHAADVRILRPLQGSHRRRVQRSVRADDPYLRQSYSQMLPVFGTAGGERPCPSPSWRSSG